MAEFVLIENNKYKIVGVLNEQDIDRINAFKNRTTLVLDNTVGLSSELISKIVSDRIVFSIKGGLDYDTKEKYREQKYVDRTYVSPSGLKNIIRYFEYNERMIDPSWNEAEKAMFLYNALVVDMEYAEKYDDILAKGIAECSLNGILYNKLVCAGFALVYKEMLDRIGIKCYYQNRKGVHDFNIIEIEGKRYGVDVTWDNANKKYHNGKCFFKNFGQDPEFYDKEDHKLYRDVDVSDDFEVTVLKRVYDSSEEVFDLSVFSLEQIKYYYSHIASRVDSREPFKYNLQEESIDIKNKFLPVDVVDYRLKTEAVQEFPIVIILDFLRKRDVLQVNPQLIDAFFGRRNYLLDIKVGNEKYRSGLNLSLIGIDNYHIDRSGNVRFSKGKEIRTNDAWGINVNNPSMHQEELSELYEKLNNYLMEYLNKYMINVLGNLDTLLDNFEYEPDNWDINRQFENGDISTKLAFVANSRDYLIQLGIKVEEVDSIIQRINDRFKEIYKPYEKTITQREHDIDFLSAVFDDVNMVWQTMEYDLQKEITEDEFVSLYRNVDYMIALFEKYVTIADSKKFQFDEYDITKEDLQQLLNSVMQDYQDKKVGKIK